MNEDAKSSVNPYMKPLGRDSLLSRPAPLAVHREQYTPNEPDEAEETQELIPALNPSARRVTVPSSSFMEEEAAEPSAAIAPETQPSAVPEDAFKQISFFAPADLPSEDTTEPFPEPAAEEPSPEEFVSNEETSVEEPVTESAVLPEQIPSEETAEPLSIAGIAMEESASAEDTAVEELPPEAESAEETPAMEAPHIREDVTEDTDPSGDDYDYNAYYSAYWAQWQAAMEAQQNRACAVCPLMGQLNGQNASVCLVPVIVTDQQGQPQDPQAVLRMAGLNAQPQQEQPAPAYVPQPTEEEQAPATSTFSATLQEHSFELPMEEDNEKVNDDDEYLGEDEMADEDMPTPQTVPPELPDLGLGKKKKSFKWLWVLLIVLLSLVVVLSIGLVALSSTGYLQPLVDKLHLPEFVVLKLKELGLL